MRAKHIKTRTYPKDLVQKIDFIYLNMKKLSPKNEWKFGEIYTDYKDCDKLDNKQLELIDNFYKELK